MIEFFFSKKLKRLQNFYVSMRNLDIDIGTFNHKYNSVESNVIFDTVDAWKLVFIKRGIGDVLVVSIKPGFRFTLDSSEIYNEFRKYFNISGEKGKFSINDFCCNLDKQIEFEYSITDEKRQVILSYNQLDRNHEGIYPIGVKNWQKFHAEHPEVPKDKYHRSNDNLMKTKQLYPNLYKVTKDFDITILYGDEPGKNTKAIITGCEIDLL